MFPHGMAPELPEAQQGSHISKAGTLVAQRLKVPLQFRRAVQNPGSEVKHTALMKIKAVDR